MHGGSGTDATVDYITDNLGRVNALALNTEGKDYEVGDEVTVKSDTVLPVTEAGGNARKVKINKIQATGIAAKTYLKQSDGKVQGIASGLTLDYTVVAGAVTGVIINDAGDGYKEDESSTGGNVEEIYLVPTADDYLNGLNSTSTNAVVKIIDTDNIKVVESTDLVLRSEDIEGTEADESKDTETYVIAGINYYPAKGLTISPNMRFNTAPEVEDILFSLNFQFKF